MKTPRQQYGRALLILVAALSFAGFGFLLPADAGVYSPETVPNVRLTDRTQYLSNPDALIAPEDAAAINRAATELEQSLGVEMAVVALKNIGENEARMFATDLFNRWGLGKKGKDNGLLILLVTDPPNRSVVFETGYGLEGVLPDVVCYRLQQRYMIPDLKQGNYSTAMAKGATAVALYLTSHGPDQKAMTALPQDQTQELDDSSILLLVLLLVLLLFVFRKNPAALLAVLNALLRGGRGGRGGGSGGPWRGGGTGGSWGGGRSGGGGSISRF